MNFLGVRLKWPRGHELVAMVLMMLALWVMGVFVGPALGLSMDVVAFGVLGGACGTALSAAGLRPGKYPFRFLAGAGLCTLVVFGVLNLIFS